MLQIRIRAYFVQLNILKKDRIIVFQEYEWPFRRTTSLVQRDISMLFRRWKWTVLYSWNKFLYRLPSRWMHRSSCSIPKGIHGTDLLNILLCPTIVLHVWVVAWHVQLAHLQILMFCTNSCNRRELTYHRILFAILMTVCMRGWTCSVLI